MISIELFDKILTDINNEIRDYKTEDGYNNDYLRFFNKGLYTAIKIVEKYKKVSEEI